LKEKLLDQGIPLYTVLVLNNLLIDRQIFASMDGINTNPRAAYRGLPQGSVLSTILFILYTADLAQKIPKNTFFTMYADDLVVFATTLDVLSSITRVEAANNKIINWLNEVKLEISTGKSCFMIFSRSRAKQNFTKIKFGTDNIARETKHKFLGIMIDENLSWKHHIEQLITRCRDANSIMRATSHKWWGSDPVTTINLYKALVRSRADYASFLYSSASKSLLVRLDRLQNSILRIILGAFPSTPIPALQIETGIPPLTIRRQLLADKYLLKKISMQSKLIIDRITSLRNNITNPEVPDSLTHKYQLVISLTSLENLTQKIRAEPDPCHSSPLTTSIFQPIIYYRNHES
jgi:hypothetical protein